MSSSNHLVLVGLPRIITAPGPYITRCGETVSIHTIIPGSPCRCLGNYSSGIAERWHPCGRVHTSRECRNDIVSAHAEEIDEERAFADDPTAGRCCSGPAWTPYVSEKQARAIASAYGEDAR